MNIETLKDPIIVGVLFILFTREWFSDLIYNTFPMFADNPWLFLGTKVLLFMLMFWMFSKIINVQS